MDPWQQAVETRLTELRADVREVGGETRSSFKWTWSALAAGFLILAGLFLTGYLRLEERLDRVDQRATARIEGLDGRTQQLDHKLDAILERLPPKPQQ